MAKASKKKPAALALQQEKRGRGRPLGSKNKRGRGRPPGSKNKKTLAAESKQLGIPAISNSVSRFNSPKKPTIKSGKREPIRFHLDSSDPSEPTPIADWLKEHQSRTGESRSAYVRRLIAEDMARQEVYQNQDEIEAFFQHLVTTDKSSALVQLGQEGLKWKRKMKKRIDALYARDDDGDQEE